MSACSGADSDMVLDAPGTNGPFQPVALMHFRGEDKNCVLLCFCGISEQWAMFFCLHSRRKVVARIFTFKVSGIRVCGEERREIVSMSTRKRYLWRLDFSMDYLRVERGKGVSSVSPMRPLTPANIIGSEVKACCVSSMSKLVTHNNCTGWTAAFKRVPV